MAHTSMQPDKATRQVQSAQDATDGLRMLKERRPGPSAVRAVRLRGVWDAGRPGASRGKPRFLLGQSKILSTANIGSLCSVRKTMPSQSVVSTEQSNWMASPVSAFRISTALS